MVSSFQDLGQFSFHLFLTETAQESSLNDAVLINEHQPGTEGDTVFFCDYVSLIETSYPGNIFVLNILNKFLPLVLDADTDDLKVLIFVLFFCPLDQGDLILAAPSPAGKEIENGRFASQIRRTDLPTFKQV